MEQVELERRLAQSPLLAGVSLPAEQARVQSFPAGHILSDRPGGVPSVGLILSGRVEVYSVALDGKDVQLSTLPAGECFGVCNLLAGAELETVLRCGEETEVLYIPKPVLLACMERDAGLTSGTRSCATKSSSFCSGASNCSPCSPAVGGSSPICWPVRTGTGV